MLELLKIYNIVVIDSAEITFREGLNILSGETGAGKSIVLEAISLLLGGRANSDLVRAECEEGVVEGFFQTKNIPWMAERLERHGFAKNTQELLIKRTIHRQGRHRISVNGELANLSTLQQICEGLIDLCGQHEHQSLLRGNTQLELLDRYGGLTKQQIALAKQWELARQLRTQLETMTQLNQERNQRSGFLRYQIQDIESARLSPGEDEALSQEKQLLQSAETRVNHASAVLAHLESDENGALNLLKGALVRLRALNGMDPRIAGCEESLCRAIAETEEVLLGLNRYLDTAGSELDPEKLHATQERLSLLADLRRKYGLSQADILSYLEKMKVEIASLEGLGDEIQLTGKQLQEAEVQLKKIGNQLTAARKKVSAMLGKSVTAELKDLGMAEATFNISIQTSDQMEQWNNLGADTVQYLVKPNPGEPAKSVAKTASGGELSRLMLAIRRVISDRGGIGVYLFDEIDAGMGGQAAFQVGKKLKSVALYNQVICITHLPQVASFADHHLIVRKTVSGKRTMTQIQTLSNSERKNELARMLAGPQLTKKSIENASELLTLARKSV